MLRESETPGHQAEALLLMGRNAVDRRDDETAVAAYTEAADLSEWSAPLFNLSLLHHRRRRYDAAERAIRLALDRNRSGPYLTLLGLILSENGQDEESANVLAEALAEFGDPAELDTPFEVGWCRELADALDDEALRIATIERRRNIDRPPEQPGELLRVANP
jgi:tetratricopeptide (TPR) repeat protein